MDQYNVQPNQNFDDFSDSSSSEDQMYLADINLSLSFFTGVNGSLDQIFANSQPTQCGTHINNDPISTKQGSIMCESQNKPKLKRSSSANFNEEPNQISFGPALPLTQSSYDFLANDQSFQNSIIEKKRPKNRRSASGFIIIEDDCDNIDDNENISLQEIHVTNKHRKTKTKTRTLFREIGDNQYTEPFDEFIQICKTIKINPKKIGLLPLENWPEGELTLDQIVTFFFQRKSPSQPKQDAMSKSCSLSKMKHKSEANTTLSKTVPLSISVPNSTSTSQNSLNGIANPITIPTHTMNNAVKLAIKLFDALKISEISPVYESLVGVTWFNCSGTNNDEIIRINISRFARLIGIGNGIKSGKDESERVEPSKILFEPSKGLLSYIGFKEMTLDQIVSLDSNADLFGIDLVNVKLIYHPSHLFRRNSTLSEILAIKE